MAGLLIATAGIYSKPYCKVKNFSDFKIAAPENPFIGDSIKIERILNRQITVFAYKIGVSKFEKGNGKCLTLALSLGDARHVLFTSASYLMVVLPQIPKENFPFVTTIVKQNERLEFT